MADGEKALSSKERPKAFWRRRWFKWTSGLTLVALTAAGIAISVLIRRAEPMLHALIVQRLEDHFHAKVELDTFHVRLANGVWAEGKGLRIWPPNSDPASGSNDSPESDAGADAAPAQSLGKPMISLADFKFHAPLRFTPGVPIHIARVQVQGLVIDVPPRPENAHRALSTSNEAGGKSTSSAVQVVVDRVDCKDAQLTIETSKPGKLPLQFDIARLTLTHVSTHEAMSFDAELTNPRPRGLIDSKGSFGPWAVDDPGQSPVAGSYTFKNADLGTFKGIAGTLNSTGAYTGVLRELDVNGVTDTPNFKLTNFGTTMPLHTVFHARVDGLNGDTYLEPVEATLGTSHFLVQGKVVHEQAQSGRGAHPAGHEITLAVNVDRGRMEDFLKLASSSGDALMTGGLKMQFTMELSPGTQPVIEKLKLKGNFALDQAQFTSAKIQKEIGELSLRGEGQSKQAKTSDGSDVQSAMDGDFTMNDETIALPNLKYTVPGAEIDLAGRYGLEGETLAFTGVAKLQATASKAVGGWKGLLLKPADKLFEKDGAGTAIPIHIDGTRQNPAFGMDLSRLGKTEPQRPGQE